ncbi:MAG TPA: hypothetical protein DCY03_33285 [Planctomycetaceae bacterium]|nr:hypothetical protein [Planctomycetaceae bacterium]
MISQEEVSLVHQDVLVPSHPAREVRAVIPASVLEAGGEAVRDFHISIVDLTTNSTVVLRSGVKIRD